MSGFLLWGAACGVPIHIAPIRVMSEQEIKQAMDKEPAHMDKPAEEHVTRRAPHMEKYVRVIPYPTGKYPDGHKVTLKIGVQSFLISDGVGAVYETKEAAIWCRDMLCIALDELITLEVRRSAERFDRVNPPISELAQRAQEKKK